VVCVKSQSPDIGLALLESHRALSRLWNIHKGTDKRHMMAMVFCDESGKQADSPVVVFAACIASDQHWAVMMEDWRKAIEGKVRYISMKEAMHFRGEFEGWEDRIKERDELLVSVAEIAARAIAFNSIAAVDSKTFLTLGQEDRKKFRDIHYMAFEGCIKQILVATAKRQDWFFHLYLDASEEYSERCLKMYLKMRYRYPEVRQRYIAITFAEDEQYPPLQFADMTAYCERAMRMSTNPPDIIKRLHPIVRPQNSVYPTIHREMTYNHGDDLGDGIVRELK